MGSADPSGWLRIALECLREEAEAVEEGLVAAGAAAVSLEDADDEPRFEPRPSARESHRPSAAHADREAAAGHAPSNRFDRTQGLAPTAPSSARRRSFGPHDPSPRRLDALAAAAKADEICGPDRPPWGQVRVSGLFPAGTDGLERMAANRVSREILETARVDVLPDTDWVRAGRDRIRPMRFGDRLWVCPTWAEPPPRAASAVVVRLDPGLAFGTGVHPSTRLCLRHLAGLDLAGKVVIDYGCGSGILGIAALGLGARRCLAVDVDPQALDTARENARRNRWAEHFDIMSPSAVADALRRAGSSTSDLLVANILAAPLAALARTFGNLVGRGGGLMLSGILSGQADGVIAEYAPWFGLAIADRDEDWVLLAGSRTR